MALFIAKRRKEFNEGPLLILSYITAAAVQLLAESSVRAARNQVKKGVRRDRAAVRAVNGASLRLWAQYAATARCSTGASSSA